MLDQILFAFGAALCSFLGTIHIIYTFFTNKLEPRDAATTAAMKATSLLLTGRTNLWNGWIGFNASFGLGLLLFARLICYWRSVTCLSCANRLH